MTALDRTKPGWMTGEVADLFELACDFFEKEAVPNLERWNEQRFVDREFWERAGELGLLLTSIPEEYGGGGGSFLHFAAVAEAIGRTGDRSWGNNVHSGIVAHYLLAHGTREQKRRWLPQLASGRRVAAIGMTEPSAGSDLKAIRTTALREGDEYVVSGQKTFITNGQTADLIVLAVKTDPAAGAHGVSLLVVETDAVSGFRRGRTLNKIGQHGADTSELFFDEVRVPAENLLGAEGGGFGIMMGELRQERLIIGITAICAMELAVRETVDYVNEREAFGAPLITMQNTRFVLAEAATQARVARVFLDDCIRRHMAGELSAAEAAMCKWWLTDQQNDVIDKLLQLYGGYGYMTEYAIARLFADARAQKIYGGANEVQKELIARTLDRTARGGSRAASGASTGGSAGSAAARSATGGPSSGGARPADRSQG
jgi:acyl-CoA dehydrogenase